MGRPSWDQYFMDIAVLVSSRSTCLRRQVGAVLVRDKHIIATGYNGAPRGVAHCLDVGCLREQLNIPSGERHEMCRGTHAEQNAIIQAALHGVSTAGATLYLSLIHISCLNSLMDGKSKGLMGRSPPCPCQKPQSSMCR